jgi:adenylate cyclase, class 2
MENIEIKARCSDLASMARAVAASGALLKWTVRQVDTYFNVPKGRLKLRRTDGASQELIFYQRPDQDSPKLSTYYLEAIASEEKIDVILAAALGVKATVYKRRQLWRLDNIRIHLDEVEGLGSFVELEVEVTPGRDAASCRAQAGALLDALAIGPADLLPGSYSDLVG